MSSTTQAQELGGLEATFGVGENFAGVPAATPTPIATNTSSVTTLASVGNLFELYPASGGPLLELGGSVVTLGQFAAGWTPVGALQTGDGYEVAFGNGSGEFVVWNTDANGNFTSAATGILSSTTQAQELGGVEANFGENFRWRRRGGDADHDWNQRPAG